MFTVMNQKYILSSIIINFIDNCKIEIYYH